MNRCPHGCIIGDQGGVAQEDIDSHDGDEEGLLLAFYSACDCCDTLMHHSSCGYGYKVMDDGRTLCIQCTRKSTAPRASGPEDGKK